jgi:hypothetical protein
MGLAVGLAGVVPAYAAAPTTMINGKRHKCTVFGTSGPDRLHGSSGNDVICGLGGNDIIDGGGGNDIIVGGTGSDTINAGTGNDVIYGGSGRDQLRGGSGNDTIDGGTDNDRLDGGSGNDITKGESGNDTVAGSTGDDKIDGGTGTDRLDSGTGADYCASDAADILASTSCPVPHLSTIRVTSPTVITRGTVQTVRLTVRVTARADVVDLWAWFSNGTDSFGVFVDTPGNPDTNLLSGTATDGVWFLEGTVDSRKSSGTYRLAGIAVDSNIKHGMTEVRFSNSKTTVTVTDPPAATAAAMNGSMAALWLTPTGS